MDPRSGLDESSAEQRRHWSNFITKFERTHGVDIFDYESLWVDKRHDNKRHPLNALSHKIIKRVKSTIIPQHIYGYRKKLKILIRNGVPFDLRAKVWWACSRANVKKKAAKPKDQYTNVKNSSNSIRGSDIEQQIDKDLPRTFPHIIDNMEHRAAFLTALKNVLMAYAVRNEKVGYCQSMNFIFAFLLLHLQNEERTFWIAAVILENIIPTTHYNNLIGVRVDQLVLQTLMANKLPAVSKHFKETETILEAIVCPWFLTLYLTALPIHVVSRVWDCMFLEGSLVLFRVGIQLLESKQDILLKEVDFSSIYALLKTENSPRGYSYPFFRSLNDGNGCENQYLSKLSSFELHGHGSQTSGSGFFSKLTHAVPDTFQSSFSHICDTDRFFEDAFNRRWSSLETEITLLRHRFRCTLLEKEREEAVQKPSPDTCDVANMQDEDFSSPSVADDAGVWESRDASVEESGDASVWESRDASVEEFGPGGDERLHSTTSSISVGPIAERSSSTRKSSVSVWFAKTTPPSSPLRGPKHGRSSLETPGDDGKIPEALKSPWRKAMSNISKQTKLLQAAFGSIGDSNREISDGLGHMVEEFAADIKKHGAKKHLQTDSTYKNLFLKQMGLKSDLISANELLTLDESLDVDCITYFVDVGDG